MKKLLLALTITAFTLKGYSQTPENPFSKYGYNVLMATSSHGEFEEFHDLKNIVEIGTFLYNTKTKEIVGFTDPKDDITSSTTAMSIDPHCERYYWISPYVYCNNNPILYVDPTGMDWVYRNVNGVHEMYYDRDIRSQDDINNKYGNKSGVMHLADGASMTTYDKNGNVTSQYTFTNDSKDNKYGSVTDMNGNVMDNSQIIYGQNYTIFGTSDNSVNAETLHSNLFGTSYTGPNNPQTYGNSSLGLRPQDSYQYNPRNLSEYAAISHDKAYDAAGAKGVNGALLDTRVVGADKRLWIESARIATAPNVPVGDRFRAGLTAAGFNQIYYLKTVKKAFGK